MSSQDPKAAPQVSVEWDDSEMRTTYANVCNVTGTREELSILFGTNRSWQGGNELSVKLSDRLVLSPYAAKRLHLLLANAIAQYEAAFGELGVQADSGAGSEVVTGPKN